MNLCSLSIFCLCSLAEVSEISARNANRSPRHCLTNCFYFFCFFCSNLYLAIFRLKDCSLNIEVVRFLLGCC